MIFVARIKQAGRWAYAGLLLGGGLVVAIVVLAVLRGKRRDRAIDAIDEVVEKAWHKSHVATARAATEIAAVRAVAGDERDRLMAILADEDEERQAQRLLSEMKRARDKP